MISVMRKTSNLDLYFLADENLQQLAHKLLINSGIEHGN